MYPDHGGTSGQAHHQAQCKEQAEWLKRQINPGVINTKPRCNTTLRDTPDPPCLCVENLIPVLPPLFPDGTPADQKKKRGQVGKAITSWTLPEATGGNDPLSYSVTGLPPGLTFSDSSLSVSGTPTSAGAFSVTYTVTDVDGDEAEQSFTYVIDPTPPEPEPEPEPEDKTPTFHGTISDKTS